MQVVLMIYIYILYNIHIYLCTERRVAIAMFHHLASMTFRFLFANEPGFQAKLCLCSLLWAGYWAPDRTNTASYEAIIPPHFATSSLVNKHLIQQHHKQTTHLFVGLIPLPM